MGGSKGFHDEEGGKEVGMSLTDLGSGGALPCFT